MKHWEMAFVTPKVLKFINYITTCIETNYKKLLKLQKTFISSLFAKMIPKIIKTYNAVENSILYYALYLQPLKK